MFLYIYIYISICLFEKISDFETECKTVCLLSTRDELWTQSHRVSVGAAGRLCRRAASARDSTACVCLGRLGNLHTCRRVYLILYHLNPLNMIVLWWRGVPQLGPHDAERRQSLFSSIKKKVFFLDQKKRFLFNNWQNYLTFELLFSTIWRSYSTEAYLFNNCDYFINNAI